MKVRFVQRTFLLILFTVCLSGCASTPTGLDNWRSFESQIYAYFNGENRGEQITALERDLEKIYAGAGNIPPGFYAHLGLLYAEMGDSVNAVVCFKMEKAWFPESAAYMDYLLKNYENL